MEKNCYNSYLLIFNITKKSNVGTLIRSAAAFNAKKIFTIIKDKKDNKQEMKFSKIRKFLGLFGNQGTAKQMEFQNFTSLKEAKEYFGQGLLDVHKEICDHFVYIPQYTDKTASLNVAIAGSIVFHHFAIWAQYPESKIFGEKFKIIEEKNEEKNEEKIEEKFEEIIEKSNEEMNKKNNLLNEKNKELIENNNKNEKNEK